MIFRETEDHATRISNNATIIMRKPIGNGAGQGMGDSTYGIRTLDEESIGLAVEVIRSGRLVVIPTDTVYGVAADPTNAEAVARIFAAKRRPAEKSVQVLLPSLNDLRRFGLTLPAPLDALARTFCPGGFSPVCVAEPDCPFTTVRVAENESVSRTQGIRIPASPATLDILAQTGPLATSSANLSGGAAAQTVEQAAAALGNSVALYLDGGPAPGPLASTVVAADPKAQSGIAILREGVVPAEALSKALAETS